MIWADDVDLEVRQWIEETIKDQKYTADLFGAIEAQLLRAKREYYNGDTWRARQMLYQLGVELYALHFNDR